MRSTSFGSADTGLQLGNNHDRPVNSIQKTDNELLRSLAFPQMLDRRDNIEPCHTNTCQWILELDEYQSWRNQSCGLLWVKGKPGAGKSTLMAFLHDKLKESQDGIHGIIRLDFFFTARGTEMQRTPLGMLRSLLNQIFDRDATIRPQVRDIYEQRCRQFGYGERKWEWPQTILEELLATAILASANEQPVIIFVDALDEAGAEPAQKLAAYFHRLIDRADKKKLTLQVCISCRHYPILESARAKAIYVEDHNQDDIAIYIKDMLLETELEDVPNLEMREVLVEELTQHTKGVFQWAHLIIPLIKQKVIEGESISDIRDWLGDILANLENVYVYILSNVITARNRDQSFLLFQWVCLAERPLTIVEIRYALAAQNAQIMSSQIEWEKLHGFVESNKRIKLRVKALSGGLAGVVSSRNDKETVQVIHQSVNDFLRVKGLALLYHGFSASMGSVGIDNILFQSQATLYQSCLIYLATICSNKQMSNFRGSKEKLICDLPFVNYATINLFIHVEKAASFRGTLLQDEKDILQRMISYWVEIYQRLDTYGKACPPTGTTTLHMASAANLIDVITSVLSDGEDTERKNEVGNTALHFAARAGHTMAGKILQERGANREAKNNNASTPLMEATKCGHLGFVEWLLDEGVDINVTAGGSCAVSLASRSRNGDLLELLLGYGGNVETALQHLDSADDRIYLKQHALDFAAATGNQNMVKFLISAGANVNYASKSDLRVPLHLAAESGQIDVVTTLLNANADPTKEDSLSRGVLHYANLSGSTSVARALESAIGQYNKGFELGLCYKAKTGAFSVYKVQITKRMSDYTLLSDILHTYKQRRCQGLRRYSLKGLSGVKPVKYEFINSDSDQPAITEDCIPLSKLLATYAGQAHLCFIVINPPEKSKDQSIWVETLMQELSEEHSFGLLWLESWVIKRITVLAVTCVVGAGVIGILWATILDKTSDGFAITGCLIAAEALAISLMLFEAQLRPAN
ncbi:hypothetical protein N7537_007425 [Penicillium hordei]|uniref:NACHT domain-containing protein n=1 Tax=Penicillium hordei TaxID=40994 RepID=A0AAD6DYM0_9EURO|nr:uncharacterized protein N7537_007425 [Penicillium hordei]KAJ5597341.1 hypothetical protein N7537_007425 [Penicillium hordei]